MIRYQAQIPGWTCCFASPAFSALGGTPETVRSQMEVRGSAVCWGSHTGRFDHTDLGKSGHRFLLEDLVQDGPGLPQVQFQRVQHLWLILLREDLGPAASWHLCSSLALSIQGGSVPPGLLILHLASSSCTSWSHPAQPCTSFSLQHAHTHTCTHLSLLDGRVQQEVTGSSDVSDTPSSTARRSFATTTCSTTTSLRDR